MTEIYLSFYLRVNRIHIYVDALRKIGSPARICFMIAKNGKTLLLAPYQNKDFKSHDVPSRVYQGNGGMQVNSMKLCRMIAALYSWDLSRSYRIPGRIYYKQKVVIFELTKAEIIEKNNDA